MAQIESRLSPGSEPFTANRSGMLALIERVRTYERRTADKSAASRARFESAASCCRATAWRCCWTPARRSWNCARWPGWGWTRPTWPRACPAAA
jgi:geranyl-CoA carboxylase beta subunit